MSYHVIIEQNLNLGGTDVSSINASGEAIGYSGGEPVLWSNTGVATILQGGSVVNALNDAGESVGYFMPASGPAQAMLWSPSWSGTGLIISNDVPFSGIAECINSSGVVVGYLGDFMETTRRQSGFREPRSTCHFRIINSATHGELRISLSTTPDGVSDIGQGPTAAKTLSCGRLQLNLGPAKKVS